MWFNNFQHINLKVILLTSVLLPAFLQAEYNSSFWYFCAEWYLSTGHAVHQRKSSTFWSNWRISFHPASILQTTCRKLQLPLFFHLFDEPKLVDFFFSFSFDDGLTITLEVAFCSFQSTLIWITQLMCYDLKMKLHCLYLPAYSYDGDGNFSALCVNSRFLWAATVNSPPRKNPPCVSLALGWGEPELEQ